MLSPKPTDKKAMEGRFVDQKGIDHGDRDFHVKAMDTDEETEAQDLEELKRFVQAKGMLR